MTQIADQVSLSRSLLETQVSSNQERLAVPDEKLYGAIVESLQSCGYRQLNDVDVSVHSGHVLLHGRVSTYYMKQLAQTSVLRLAGVERLENELLVA